MCVCLGSPSFSSSWWYLWAYPNVSWGVGQWLPYASPFFFVFKKKSRALWLKKNSGLILASLFINILLYLVLIHLIFEFKLKLNFIHLLNKININIIFPKFELDLFINNCTFFLEKKQLYCYVSWTRACCQEACSNFLSSNYHKLLTKR